MFVVKQAPNTTHMLYKNHKDSLNATPEHDHPLFRRFRRLLLRVAVLRHRSAGLTVN